MTFGDCGLRPSDAIPSACACPHWPDPSDPYFQCSFCERRQEEARQDEADRLDAERWRFTQRPGYYFNLDYEVDEIESNVVGVHLNKTWVGVGHDLQSAVDCALMLTSAFGDAVPCREVLRVYRTHYKRRWDGERWQMPPRPDFAALAKARGEA